ncbi:protein FAM53A-like [Haliotis rufescens]|uniref:protein FAM53A-like n=1 Tax=Haliotis rufescens TaxID=6454 RepID=UPI001EB0A8C3|nr:protein FAM53A-like [Haliotis rufescens]XP_046333038.1 protein FAM53A-like [Haliotis rufescens]XP_046333039.1 protein FAM53A-like [Haliotis rufescens]
MIRCGGSHFLIGQGVTTQPHLHGPALSPFAPWFYAFQASLLSQTMLALITEKLQNQSLDDAAAAAAAVSANQAARHLKIPISREEAINLSPTSPASLAVKGKNVWALPVPPSQMPPPSAGGKGKGDNSGSRHGKSCDKHSSVVTCRHKNPLHKCILCDTNSGIAPPKKKHCRSLSVPVDSMTSSPWQPDGTKLWRPIAVIPLTNNNVDQQNRNITSRVPEFKPTCRNVTNFTRFVSSPLSMDSGHFTTSDFQTPPGSPVPRPASALSDFSQSSFGAPWLEHSPLRNNRFEILQNRSLSYEEQISLGAGSTPCMSEHLGSNPSSPYRHKIPRCRSQPCVLHDRRYAKKRRREDCRPTLNFQKMTETAYGRVRRSVPVGTPGADSQKRSSRFHEELESAMSLMPIASSPLDPDIPIRKVINTYPPVAELSRVATLDLPPTPPQSSSCSGFDIQQPVRLIGEEDSESGCGCRGDDLEDEGMELFPLCDLDIEQIENH